MVVETCTFSEALDDEGGFSFDSLSRKVKPAGHSFGVELIFQLNFVGIFIHFFGRIYVSRLKVASKDGISDLDGFPIVREMFFLLHDFVDHFVSVKLLWIRDEFKLWLLLLNVQGLLGFVFDRDITDECDGILLA